MSKEQRLYIVYPASISLLKIRARHLVKKKKKVKEPATHNLHPKLSNAFPMAR